MSKLHKLYQQILDFAGFKVEEDGELSITLNGRDFPADIDGKKLKFPYQDCLKNLDPEREIIFHPFQEYINRGESDVVRKLRRIINIRLNIATISVIDALMTVLSNPAVHSKLTPQQRELIKSVDVIDDVLRGRFMSMAAAGFSAAPDSLFVNIYTKKSGTFRGERHPRVGVVTFPGAVEKHAAFEKLKDKEFAKVMQVFAFAFPGYDEAEAYNGFSDSVDCPWLDCLLRTAANVAGRLNELWDMYGSFVDNENVIKFNLDWLEGIDNLNALKKEIALIPSQRGNEGADEAAQAQAQAAVTHSQVGRPAMTIPEASLNPPPVQNAAPVHTQVPVAPVQEKPIWGDAVKPLPPSAQQPLQVAPVARTSDGKVSFSDLMRAGQQNQPPQQPQFYQQPVQNAVPPHLYQQQLMQYQHMAAHSPTMASLMPHPAMSVPVDPWGRPIVHVQQQPTYQAVPGYYGPTGGIQNI